MAINNEKFIILLGESKSTCGLKLEAFKLTLGTEDTKLIELTTEARKMYEEFADPSFTFVSFTFDEPKIRGFLADINEVEVKKENFPSLETHLNGMLRFLSETALKEAKAARKAISQEGINAVVIATLGQCAARITNRIKWFKEDRTPKIDIREDTDYQRRREEQDEIKEVYKEKLKDQSIVGNESHVLEIKNIGKLVAASTDKTGFYNQYDRLTNFMFKQVTAVMA